MPGNGVEKIALPITSKPGNIMPRNAASVLLKKGMRSTSRVGMG
jgi:hypothetical protein